MLLCTLQGRLDQLRRQISDERVGWEQERAALHQRLEQGRAEENRLEHELAREETALQELRWVT